MAAALTELRTFAQRALSARELRAARSLFGPAPWLEQVRLTKWPDQAPFFAMVPFGRTVLYGRWRLLSDFAATPETSHQLGWLMHELVHCYQAEQGLVLAFAKLKALSMRDYVLPDRLPERFDVLNIEQQAEIGRRLFETIWTGSSGGVHDLSALNACWPIGPEVRRPYAPDQFSPIA